jgi:hypothetical protein
LNKQKKKMAKRHEPVAQVSFLRPGFFHIPNHNTPRYLRLPCQRP